MNRQQVSARQGRRPKRRATASSRPRASETASAAIEPSQRVSPVVHGGGTRVASLDALRGVAIVAMVIYHFCFDLRYFGVTDSDFEHDPFWLTARSLILSSFMLIAGISMVLAHRRSGAHGQWLRHVAIIGAAALLATGASRLMFAQSFIWFGVLHAIAVSLLLARPLIDRPAAAAITGAVVIVAGATFTHAAFDGRALGWIGFTPHKPVTEDYVPLFPWTGVLLVGLAAGQWLVRRRFAVLAPLARAPFALQWLGRHSLAVYLLHQPLMLGALWLGVHR